MGPIYLDTSALVKLVVEEPESGAVRRLLEEAESRVSSEIAVVELLRAARRVDPSGALDLESRAFDVLETISLYSITRGLLMASALLTPPHLRSLDALHLATALELRGQIEAFVAYDGRLAGAARAHGLAVLAPV